MDASPDMVRECFPQVKLIENEKNVGFAGANNQAIRQSSGRYLLLLNPDTEVEPHALERLMKFMETHSQAGAAGAQILNPDRTLQVSCFPAPTIYREFWRLFHLEVIWPYGAYRMADWSLDQPREVDILLGACLFVRRAALDQVGLLDENYFIYSEEVDICYRLQKGGWSIHWVPQAKVIHYEGQSTQQAAAEMFMYLYQGKLFFIRKHYGWLAGQIYKLILLVTALARLIISPLVWLERPSRRQKHLALASRYWQLVRTLPEM
jgi:GT2 family glycosyltransferase